MTHQKQPQNSLKISEKEYQYLTSELRLQSARLEVLEEMFKAFPSGTSLHSGMTRIAGRIRKVLAADTVILHIPRQDFIGKPILCLQGSLSSLIRKHQRAVLSHAEVEVCRRRRFKAGRTFSPDLLNVRNWIASPFLLGKVVYGFVVLINKQGKPNFTRNDSRFLAAFAQHAMMLLQNRELLFQSEKKIRELSILIRASELGNSTIELHHLLHTLIDAAKRLIGAQASSIMLFNEHSKALDFYAASSAKADKLQKLTVPLGAGVASWVFQNKKPVIINDVTKDARFYPEVDKQTRFKTRSLLAVPLLAKDEIVGVIEVVNKLSGDFSVNDMLLLTAIASQTGMSIQNARLFRKTEKLLFNTVSSLSQAIDAKDQYTSGHSSRVTDFSVMIAEGLGLPLQQVKNVRLAGLLHDIGKIGINEKILLKPGKLNDEEWEVIRQHPLIGERILGHIEEIKEILPGIRNHHEHFNGAGYPDRIGDGGIPLIGRIIAVADAYDAMVSERPYKPALSPCQAVSELRRCAGKQFDPIIVSVFIDQLKSKNLVNQ
jgi:response regulator RpfG family c-di-GMP phosphodiesterase